MSPVIFLSPIIVFICLYCWWKFSPYSKFSNHFWIDLNLIRILLFEKKRDRGHLILEKFRALCKKNESEGIFVLWLNMPVMIVFGEEAIKFFSNEASLVDKPKIYKVFNFMGETSIFVSSGKRFKRIKKMMMPAFYPNVVKNIVPVMNHHAACLVEALDETGGLVTDRTEQFLKNNALRTFLEASMGIKADSEGNKIKIQRLVILFLKLLSIASYRLYTPWLHSDFIMNFFPIGQEYIKLREELDSITEEVLQDIKETVLSRMKSSEADTEDNSSRQKSLGEVLIEQHLKDPSFDMEEVKNQVVGILTGGYDTTSNTLMFCFWLLGHHQDIQQKAYEEVMSITNGDIEFEDGRNLTYLECILKEVLRLYPPAPIYGRTSSKDLTYNNRTIPKGTWVVLFLYDLHRNPQIYSNPDDFIPERFAGDESNRKPWAYLPFAEGVRACIGKHFAMLEMKVVLAHVLRKFKIHSADRLQDIKLKYEIILKPTNPFLMRFIPR